MVRGSRLVRKQKVMMPRRRLSLPEKFIISYVDYVDRVVKKLIKGSLTEQEKRDIAELERKFPERASIVSSYLTRKKR